ncbi:MAG: molybdopterin dinucleotide binding domain-containing protein, partial [Bacteroidota bacterium]
MHNSHRLVKGRQRCTAMIHPEDASKLGIDNGQEIKVRSATGAVQIPAEVTDSMMPGVISIPHGWGHGKKGVKLDVAQAHAGVSLNDLTDHRLIDPVTGNAAFSGVPVHVSA